ncbi:hypothetical protein P152DRAFT_477457 [Eremomyces bilateralis CBS 781.70]|uniref:Uncharacterized protein n=1 Tax=Eremomyces bilateralis CBS 781.70 TaxID=1392243 RepID=A0A6G1FRG4_9PEZI|nr:uncharacterized protein P152DRAFT_477457 [Eremomyces bilateralis CBS 781.70]KAF1808316.1 hypothetical protein P152DRAFT_477457 [Eremomyces bilateralis CBS 781.70]
MNWVGGRLRRHSKANSNTAKARQREYFAKQKGKLGTESLSYFENFRPDFLPPDKASSQWQGRQQKLEEFESVAPVVKRLISMTPRVTGTSKSHGPKNSLQGKLDLRSNHAESANIADRLQHQVVPRASPSGKLDVSDEHSNPGEKLTREEWLKEQRNRLLAQDDWAGLRVTQPLRMAFVSDAERSMIGKRRKINGDGISMFAKRHLKQANTTTPEPTLIQTHTNTHHGGDKGDIIVRIGTNALDSTQHSSRPNSLSFDPFESPDSMLLDHEAKPSSTPLKKKMLDVRTSIQQREFHPQMEDTFRDDDFPMQPPPSSVSWVHTQYSPTPYAQNTPPSIYARAPASVPIFTNAYLPNDRPYTGYAVSEEEDDDRCAENAPACAPERLPFGIDAPVLPVDNPVTPAARALSIITISSTTSSDLTYADNQSIGNEAVGNMQWEYVLGVPQGNGIATIGGKSGANENDSQTANPSGHQHRTKTRAPHEGTEAGQGGKETDQKRERERNEIEEEELWKRFVFGSELDSRQSPTGKGANVERQEEQDMGIKKHQESSLTVNVGTSSSNSILFIQPSTPRSNAATKASEPLNTSVDSSCAQEREHQDNSASFVTGKLPQAGSVSFISSFAASESNQGSNGGIDAQSRTGQLSSKCRSPLEMLPSHSHYQNMKWKRPQQFSSDLEPSKSQGFTELVSNSHHGAHPPRPSAFQYFPGRPEHSKPRPLIEVAEDIEE